MPVHLGSMAYAMHSIVRAKDWMRGDLLVLNDPFLKSVMLKRANGAHTVPQIFINDHHIGGWNELFSLEQAGKLDKVLMAK